MPRLDALGGGLPYVRKGRDESDRIERSDDEVGDIIVEVGRTERDPIVQQRLLEAGVDSAAGLRLEVGIGDRIECRKVHIQFGQSRRLEAGAVREL